MQTRETQQLRRKMSDKSFPVLRNLSTDLLKAQIFKNP